MLGGNEQAMLGRVFAACEAAWEHRASQRDTFQLAKHAFASWQGQVQVKHQQLAKQHAASIADTHR